MGKIKNTIEINGKLYDATTGALIRGTVTEVSKPVIKKHKNIDGIVSDKPIKVNSHSPVKHPERSKSQFSHHVAPPAKPKLHQVERPAKLSNRRKVEPSHTLMRSAVKKPNTTTKHSFKAKGHTDSLVNLSAHPIHRKSSVHKVDEKRLRHAKRINKSESVTRFSKSSTTHSFVAPAKAHKPHSSIAPPKPIVHHKKTTDDILQQAIDHANSHRQPALKKRMTRPKRIASMAALGVASFALLGFVVSQSMPTLEVRLASAEAGFAARLPGYQPAGYHLGQLKYATGEVAMNFASNSDETREYKVTQKPSEWDSTTLRDLFVKPNDKNFQAIQTGGRTVYIYGQNNATWVDNGVWYQVHSTGALSERQLVDIAKSL